MPEGASSIVYFDPSVWIAQFFTNDHYTNQAHDLLDKVVSGKYTCMVSGLVILEVIHVIKTKITKEEKFDVQKDADIEFLERKINEKLNNFFMATDKLRKNNGLVYTNPDLTVPAFFTKCENIMRKMDIKTNIYQRHLQNKYEYRGPGHWDVQHAIIAHQTNCTTLFTMDHGYISLDHMSEFKNLQFVVLD